MAILFDRESTFPSILSRAESCFFMKLFVIFLSFYSYSQNLAPGCSDIDLGPDTIVSCNSPCVTLNASILDVGLTTTYTIDPLTYSPPYPFNQGNQILVNIDDVWSRLISLPFNFCFFAPISLSRTNHGSPGPPSPRPFLWPRV